ncbi:MAG: arsenate reductase ArsC [Dehalococcoidia bacterium]
MNEAALTERTIGLLSAEFAHIDPARVRALYEDSVETMSRRRVTTYAPALAERLTRERLRAISALEAGGAIVPGVLFLCVHNAGRSQMAAGFARALGGDRVAVYSGGSDPAEHLNPAVIEAMREAGIDIHQEFPKPWTDEVLRAVNVIISMGCGDECPVYPGVRVEEWELQDPAGQGIESVRPIRDEIEQRVRALLTGLGVDPRTAGAEVHTGSERA